MKSAKRLTILCLILFMVFTSIPASASSGLNVQAGEIKYEPGDLVDLTGSSVAESVAVQVCDPRGNIVFIDQVAVSDNRYSTSFTLNQDAVSGEYIITAMANQAAATGKFQVYDETKGSSSSGKSNHAKPASNEDNSDRTVIDSDLMDRETVIGENGETKLVFTVNDAAGAIIEDAITNGRKVVEYIIETGGENANQSDAIVFNIPGSVFQSTGGLSMVITTNWFSLELPEELVANLIAAERDFSILIDQADLDEVKEQVGNIVEASGYQVVGPSVKIGTDLTGRTAVILPLTGVDIPLEAEKAQDFLNSLKVFAIHSDGTNEVIAGEIIYDVQGNPLSLRFYVDKFSTFTSVKPCNPVIGIRFTLNVPQATVNEQTYTLGAGPYVKTGVGRTMVPVRFLCEALGAKVNWVQGVNTVEIKDDSTIISFAVGANNATVSGDSRVLDCPAEVVSGSTYVPLRFVSEALGAKVDYNRTSKQIMISK